MVKTCTSSPSKMSNVKKDEQLRPGWVLSERGEAGCDRRGRRGAAAGDPEPANPRAISAGTAGALGLEWKWGRGLRTLYLGLLGASRLGLMTRNLVSIRGLVRSTQQSGRFPGEAVLAIVCLQAERIHGGHCLSWLIALPTPPNRLPPRGTGPRPGERSASSGSPPDTLALTTFSARRAAGPLPRPEAEFLMQEARMDCVPGRPVAHQICPSLGPLPSGPSPFGEQTFLTWSKMPKEKVGLVPDGKSSTEHPWGSRFQGGPRLYSLGQLVSVCGLLPRARERQLGGLRLGSRPSRGRWRRGALDRFPERCAAVLRAAARWSCGSAGGRGLPPPCLGNRRPAGLRPGAGAQRSSLRGGQLPGRTKPPLGAQGLPTDSPRRKRLASWALFSPSLAWSYRAPLLLLT
ncbi:unnamed protein product [Rangifer tarandus platyrhynchus]|uniref:Uncharacterized protein n=1 Tax=Rangifer tarandus platyrhynchus TaxID=3082113 RepID=A0ABN8YW34_RANTA|nr:unnamed protein product [Rangifer tarandus platyrhynchus]